MNRNIFTNKETSKIVDEILKKGRIVEAEEETEKDTEEKESKAKGEPELYKLDSKVIEILNNRIKDEYTAHYYYRAATNWCQDMNYKKAAEFFKNEADDELEHAQKIQEYMTGFNILPEIEKTETKHTFDNLIDIVYGAYTMELALMKEYNKNSQEVFQEDLTTFDFLQQYREFQKGAVVEYNDLINASNLVDKTDKFQILYFEQTYF